jgi:hypothetical protein
MISTGAMPDEQLVSDIFDDCALAYMCACAACVQERRVW